jgi:diguanylate cyclase (GGDEF)-like protein
MRNSQPRLSKREQDWSRRILNTYWAIVLLQALGQSLVLLFFEYTGSPLSFLINLILIPSGSMSLVLGLTEWMLRRYIAYFIYVLLISGTFISMMIVISNGDVRVIPAVFLITIFVSAVYFRAKLVIYTTALQFLSFFLVCLISDEFFNRQSDFDLLATPIVFIGGAFIAWAITVRGNENISDLEMMMLDKYNLLVLNDIYQRQARTDALTGLDNHTAFQEAFDMAVQSANEGKTQFNLALLDIDNFKSINDTYGHQTGNIVLIRIAEVIRRAVSPSDVVARYGGEEFVLLLNGLSGEEAIRTMEQIRAEVAALVIPEITGRVITISSGLKRHDPGESKEHLFEQTDAWLYEAKSSGKNRVVCHR